MMRLYGLPMQHAHALSIRVAAGRTDATVEIDRVHEATDDCQCIYMESGWYAIRAFRDDEAREGPIAVLKLHH